MTSYAVTHATDTSFICFSKTFYNTCNNFKIYKELDKYISIIILS